MAEKSGATGASRAFSPPAPSSSKNAYIHLHAAPRGKQVDEK